MAVLVVLGTSILWAAIHQIFLVDIGYDESSYNLDEWLINYSGGFVRRGFAGEVVWRIAETFHVQPAFQVVLISVLALVALFAFFLASALKVVRAPFLLSTFVLAGPVMDGDIIRKDIIGMLALALSLFVLTSKRFGYLARPWRVLMVNGVCILSLLDHEAFGFYALPVILVQGFSFYGCPEGVLSVAQRGQRCILDFAPSLGVFLLTLIFKGDQRIANLIHLSWVRQKELFLDSRALHGGVAIPGSAIGAIGWQGDVFLGQIGEILTGHSGPIWIPLAWLVTIVLGLILFRHFSSGLSAGSSSSLARFRSYSMAVCMFQLMAVSPLFLIAKDYGRWIYIWMITSVIILSFDIGCLERALVGIFRKTTKRLCDKLPSVNSNVALILLVLIGIPECNWTIPEYIEYTPLFSFVKIVSIALGRPIGWHA